MDLQGKVALVTGGSGDIGRAIAQKLASAGVVVAFTYSSHIERAKKTVEILAAEGVDAMMVELDQSDPQSIRDCGQTVLSAYGRLDILVNNAAWNIGIPFPDLEALSSDVWQRMFAINLLGPYLLCRELAGELKRHQHGRIVNVASLAGLAPTGSSIAYAATKAGLVHLTRCLAVALAPHVTVNCVAPGLVEGTRMADRLPEGMKEKARRAPVLGRTGSIDDIADQTLTFCRSDSVTGQVLVVDGGLPLGMR